MFYKEWQRARSKFTVILIIYTLAGLLVSTVFGPTVTGSSDSIFHRWVLWTFYITLGAAILSGSDTFAEELGNNTLGFLLTKPLSRASIYTAKFLVNAAAIAVILLVSSPLMFLIEQTPQGYMYGVAPQVNGTPYTQYFFVPSPKMPAGEAFNDIAAILGLGLVVLAVTTIVSIFCRTTSQALIATILLIMGLVAVFALTDGFLLRLSYGMTPVYIQELFNWLGVGVFVVLGGVAAGIFTIGLRIFKEKEF